MPLLVSKAIDLPSGDQPKSAITPLLRQRPTEGHGAPRMSVMFLPPCGETRRSAGQFGAFPRRYAIFPPVGDHSGCWPTLTSRRRLLPFVLAVQMPNVFPDPLDASRSKATFVPSGESLAAELTRFLREREEEDDESKSARGPAG